MIIILIVCGAFLSTASAYKDPLVLHGRSVNVHLFEWKWTDIAKECENFLGPMGYGSVQISPPTEHKREEKPWWIRYQPVSYKLESRGGSEAELRNMIERCNRVGVRIYVDSVFNHMAGGSGVGVNGSVYSSGDRSYQAVPYTSDDFNDKLCKSKSGDIESYQDMYQVRDCRLSGMPDLALGNEYVRNKISEYMNKLIDMGVAGFRIDGAKHMWPGDLEAVQNSLHNVRADVFGRGKRPFIYHEVIDHGGEPIKNTDYLHLGRVTEFKYGQYLSDAINRRNNQRLSFLKSFGEAWGFIAGSDALAFVSNHDNQRDYHRSVLSFFEPRQYKIGSAFMFAWPYGLLQLISSFRFDFYDQGAPSVDGFTAKDVSINPDNTCNDGWVCEHRWRQIYNMVKFSNVATYQPVKHWWDNGYHQVAFARGNKAFIAINNEPYVDMDLYLQTGLPQGAYCDVISGNLVNGKCTGKQIVVYSDGKAKINIRHDQEDPVIAIHVEARL